MGFKKVSVTKLFSSRLALKRDVHELAKAAHEMQPVRAAAMAHATAAFKQMEN